MSAPSPAGIRRGFAAPCFAEDLVELVAVALQAEEDVFDGYFHLDHILCWKPRVHAEFPSP